MNISTDLNGDAMRRCKETQRVAAGVWAISSLQRHTQPVLKPGHHITSGEWSALLIAARYEIAESRANSVHTLKSRPARQAS